MQGVKIFKTTKTLVGIFELLEVLLSNSDLFRKGLCLGYMHSWNAENM